MAAAIVRLPASTTRSTLDFLRPCDGEFILFLAGTYGFTFTGNTFPLDILVTYLLIDGCYATTFVSYSTSIGGVSKYEQFLYLLMSELIF